MHVKEVYLLADCELGDAGDIVACTADDCVRFGIVGEVIDEYDDVDVIEELADMAQFCV